MAANWYYAKNNEKHGPFEAVELKKLAAIGTILRDTPVWKIGANEWVKASAVTGLFMPASIDVPPFDEQPAEWSPSAATQPPGSQALASDSSFGSGSFVAVQNTKTKKKFPNLVFLAEIFRTIAIVCVVIGGLIAGLCVFWCVIAVVKDEPFSAVFLIIGAASLLAFMFIAMLYRAFAEMIYLALYAATLLEDIRNK